MKNAAKIASVNQETARGEITGPGVYSVDRRRRTGSSQGGEMESAVHHRVGEEANTCSRCVGSRGNTSLSGAVRVLPAFRKCICRETLCE